MSATKKRLEGFNALSGLEPEGEQQPARVEPTTTGRTKEVRLSVALAPGPYHQLVTYTNTLAMALGLPRIAHVKIIRALLEELQNDTELQEKVKQRVIDSHM